MYNRSLWSVEKQTSHPASHCKAPDGLKMLVWRSWYISWWLTCQNYHFKTNPFIHFCLAYPPSYSTLSNPLQTDLSSMSNSKYDDHVLLTCNACYLIVMAMLRQCYTDSKRWWLMTRKWYKLLLLFVLNNKVPFGTALHPQWSKKWESHTLR